MVTIKLVIEILRQNICLILPIKACNHMHVVVMTIIVTDLDTCIRLSAALLLLGMTTYQLKSLKQTLP